jgi:hypothetical protein
MFPSKFKVSGGDAEYFDIDINITVSNSNDVGVWADMNVKLMHRKGMDWRGELTRVPFSKPRDEVWCLYVAGEGMVVDFSQNRIVDLMKPQDYDTMRGYIGLFVNPLERPPEGFDYADTSHRVNPNARSSFSGRPILVPPNSNMSFQTVLTIPGPAASEGMADFWEEYGSPDFDLEISVVEVAHYYPDPPHAKETGAVVAIKRLNDIIEIQLDRTQFDDTYDYFDDLGVFEQKSVETTWYEEDY